MRTFRDPVAQHIAVDLMLPRQHFGYSRWRTPTGPASIWRRMNTRAVAELSDAASPDPSRLVGIRRWRAPRDVLMDKTQRRRHLAILVACRSTSRFPDNMFVYFKKNLLATEAAPATAANQLHQDSNGGIIKLMCCPPSQQPQPSFKTTVVRCPHMAALRLFVASQNTVGDFGQHSHYCYAHAITI